MTLRRWRWRGAAALLVAALATTVVALGHPAPRAAAGGDRCAGFRADAAERAGLVTGSGPETLVVGDSWAAGLGLDDLAGSWPTRLTGRVRVSAFSGSGFSRDASECGDVSFASRTARALSPATSRVVVAGGLNDVDRSTVQISAGFARLVAALEGRSVVVVGPAAAPSRAAAAERVDAVLRRLTAGAGWQYVAAYDWELGYLPDGLHLTPAGHAAFGDRVRDALAAPPG